MGKLDPWKLNRGISIAECVPCLGRSKFRERADISSLYLWGVDRIFTVHERRFSEAFHLSSRRVADLRIPFQRAGIDTEEAQLSCKRIGNGFEYNSRHRCIQ